MTHENTAATTTTEMNTTTTQGTEMNTTTETTTTDTTTAPVAATETTQTKREKLACASCTLDQEVIRASMKEAPSVAKTFGIAHNTQVYNFQVGKALLSEEVLKTIGEVTGHKLAIVMVPNDDTALASVIANANESFTTAIDTKLKEVAAEKEAKAAEAAALKAAKEEKAKEAAKAAKAAEATTTPVAAAVDVSELLGETAPEVLSDTGVIMDPTIAAAMAAAMDSTPTAGMSVPAAEHSVMDMTDYSIPMAAE